MLNALRDGAKSGFLKFILLGFMALAVGGLVLTDVGGFFRGGISSNVVAEGKGIEISIREFDTTVRRALATQNISSQQAYQMGYINAILRNELQMRLFSRDAERLGLRVGDDLVTQQISKIAEPLAEGGQDKGAALKQVLRARGITEGQFISSVRQEMANTALQNAIASSGVILPDLYTKQFYAAKNQSRDVRAFVLKNSGIKDIEAPTEEQLTAYYEANKMQYATPEMRKLTLAILKPEMVTDTIDITEDEIQEAYEYNIEAYTKQERRQVQQAILSTPELANNVAKKIAAGSSLKKAVQNVTGDVSAYLGQNDFAQNGLPEDIAGPVFAAKQGETVGPLQTALGWHVMVVTKLLDAEVEPLDKVRAELKKALLQERSLETLLETANIIDDRLAGGEDLDILVDEFKMSTRTVGPIKRDGVNKKNKNELEAYGEDALPMLEVGFDYETGESAPVIETADGQFVIVRVDDITPLTYAPLEDIKTGLEKQYIEQQRSLMNRARAQDMFASLEGGADFKELAKNAGARIQTFSKLKADQDAPKLIGPLALSRLFTKNQGEAVLGETDGGIVIAQVSEIYFADPDKTKKEDLEDLTETLRSESSTTFLATYVDRLINKADIKINDRLLARTYGMGSE